LFLSGKQPGRFGGRLERAVTRPLAITLVSMVSMVGVAVLLGCVFTPTISIRVKNDTDRSVEVSTCGSDPVTIGKGQTATVDPNPNDPKAACEITAGDNTTKYLGCLQLPTTKFRDGSIVKVSRADTAISAQDWGD